MAMVARIATLLERERELAVLLEAWRAARRGRGSAWVICAEAGGGKTRLARELAHAAGNRTLWGAAEPVTPPEPFLAVIDAIPGFHPAATRAESVRRAVSLLAAHPGPLLLVLDDLHFADDGTAAVLLRLASACAVHPWLVVAALRPGEAPPAVREAVTESVAQGWVTRLDPAPLSRDGVAALVEELRGTRPSPAEILSIYADSGGNPWFVEALARGDGALAAARDRIALRLDRIEAAAPGARRLLTALAPATRPLPHAAVAALRGGDTLELRRLLAHLRDTSVLREDGAAWAFRHELLRRALLDAMIPAERREAHRTLAETLEALVIDGSATRDRAAAAGAQAPSRAEGGAGAGSSTRRAAPAAELAMHYEAAGDARAVDWALQAAREAQAIDARGEAMAQLARALAFELPPDLRRSTLDAAARTAYQLGRFADSRRYAEAALAIPGATAETAAGLHWLASRAARMHGDIAADDAHLTAAERALAGRGTGYSRVQIAVARVAQAAYLVQPDRLPLVAERALRVARASDAPGAAARAEVQVRMFLILADITAGDPAAFPALAELERFAREQELHEGYVLTALANAADRAVLSLFHAEARSLRARALAGLERLEVGWGEAMEPYAILELVQRARYDEARPRAASLPAPTGGTIEHALLGCATVLREARAGSLERARTQLAAMPTGTSFLHRALRDLAALEIDACAPAPDAGERAQRVYGTMNRRRFARVAAVAAVALARGGRGAPPAPDWLAPAAPLRVFWRWAEALTRADGARLRTVSADLQMMACPYEAALALRDAGDLRDSYRALRLLEATTAREQLAHLLRAQDAPIPRRARAAAGTLTETERAVCRLVAGGATNALIADALGVSPRTVETHLTAIYRKTGRRGRVALAQWWTETEDRARAEG